MATQIFPITNFNGEINDMDNDLMSRKKDFSVSKFYAYSGPNLYIDRPALVFNLYLDPDGPSIDFYKEKVFQKFPKLAEKPIDRVAYLFAETLMQVCKMDIDVLVNKYAVNRDGDEWEIGIEQMDDHLAEKCVYFVCDWFSSMNENDSSFDFNGGFAKLQAAFDKTLHGGPTIYSLYEGGVIRGIPVHYYFEENQFQWGYGKKQQRGRSTIFHSDGIKDTEFTQYKDMVGEFLELCGLPTPKGVNCFSEEEILREAKAIGFPCVVKPVAGHKGQGVTTGIMSFEEVSKAFNAIVKSAQEAGVNFEGALVQKQIYGHDHRILTIGGKYAACLKRIPAYIVGDGKHTIKELIDIDNLREVRADTARSPLCKIKLDETMHDFLKLQNRTAQDIPAAGEEVVLRRVANISAGGVSVNVTDFAHPDNILLAEDIARFFKVTAMGIDVLARDITKSWKEGDFGIIEINAGPGVFMHLAPAEGGSVDVPGKIMAHFFGKDFKYSRIPIIAGNSLSDNLINRVGNYLKGIKEDVGFGSIRKDGVYFGERLFVNNQYHDTNCALLMRNPDMEFVMMNHTADDIHDYGMFHFGSDVVILEHPNYAEYTMKRDLLPDGICIEIRDVELSENEVVAKLQAEVAELKQKLGMKEAGQTVEVEAKSCSGDTKTMMIVSKGGKEISRTTVLDEDKFDELIFNALEPFLKELLYKYEIKVK